MCSWHKQTKCEYRASEERHITGWARKQSAHKWLFFAFVWSFFSIPFDTGTAHERYNAIIREIDTNYTGEWKFFQYALAAQWAAPSEFPQGKNERKRNDAKRKKCGTQRITALVFRHLNEIINRFNLSVLLMFTIASRYISHFVNVRILWLQYIFYCVRRFVLSSSLRAHSFFMGPLSSDRIGRTWIANFPLDTRPSWCAPHHWPQ